MGDGGSEESSAIRLASNSLDGNCVTLALDSNHVDPKETTQLHHRLTPLIPLTPLSTPVSVNLPDQPIQ